MIFLLHEGKAKNTTKTQKDLVSRDLNNYLFNIVKHFVGIEHKYDYTSFKLHESWRKCIHCRKQTVLSIYI